MGLPVEACFTVEGLESVEVAMLTPARARERNVAIPGDPNPEDWRAAPPAHLRAGYVILSIYPSLMIPTASALSVAAGARKHRNQTPLPSRLT